MPRRKRPPLSVKNRRVYLRFTEQDFCLLQRMCVLDSKCIADLLQEIVMGAARDRARGDWALAQWWSDEKFRIALEETNVPER